MALEGLLEAADVVSMRYMAEAVVRIVEAYLDGKQARAVHPEALEQRKP